VDSLLAPRRMSDQTTPTVHRIPSDAAFVLLTLLVQTTRPQVNPFVPIRVERPTQPPKADGPGTDIACELRRR